VEWPRLVLPDGTVFRTGLAHPQVVSAGGLYRPHRDHPQQGLRPALQRHLGGLGLTDNTTVGGCTQLPASIVGNAGLQPAYQQLDPGPAVTDHTAPTEPGKPTAVTHFPIVADLSWPAATDDTGYSVYSDGKLVSASGGTSLRLPGLTAGATYTFTVTARDAAGNESAPSGPVTVTIPAGSDLALNKPVTVSSYSSPNIPAWRWTVT
jgi:hypothetical protein